LSARCSGLHGHLRARLDANGWVLRQQVVAAGGGWLRRGLGCLDWTTLDLKGGGNMTVCSPPIPPAPVVLSLALPPREAEPRIIATKIWFSRISLSTQP